MHSSGFIDERFLVARLQQDDRKVFELIFKFYYTGLVVYAERIIGNTEMSEDIVQWVFMKLWEERKSLRIDSLRSYLGVAVKNRSIDLIRSQRVQDRYLEYLREREIEQEESFYTFREMSEMINQAIDKLPPRCREIFLMSRFRHMKTLEIARELQLSGRTVETQISHALKILRTELKDYFYLILAFSEMLLK
ncbi:MAG: RNA polymerase sigma-70 factor [Prolixibacteraceae bacterium]